MFILSCLPHFLFTGYTFLLFYFFSSRRRHTRSKRDSSSDVCSSDLVAKLKGISNQEISDIVKEYKGMRHRIQPVANVSGRSFYNDSKATNITATITALNSFKQPIRFIGGGLDRGNEFDELIPYLKNVSGAYLYGETKDKMAKAFKAAGVNTIEIFDDLIEDTSKAYREARQ